MFTFTEAELLNSQLSHARFAELVNKHNTAIHEIKLSTNLYGEFMFVTLSAHIPTLMWGGSAKAELRHVTFWGMGYHESRERWDSDQWRWHEAQLFGKEASSLKLSKSRVWADIDERRAFCLLEAQSAEPVSTRAQAFTFFADMGDEDGATTMIEDMDAWGVDVESMFDE